MRRFLLALAVCSAAPFSAMAENTPVVVELFTSQGCSSCPPADEMMHQLAERDDVVALSLHVDYWDYIGWKDEFADPRHAKRQRAYAVHGARRSVYTPEMIVNGESDIVGARPLELSAAIEAHKAKPRKVALTTKRDGSQLTIHAEPIVQIEGPVLVQLIRYQDERTANITRGENAGRTISYMNVAQDWQVLDVWDGQSEFETQVALSDDLPAVVLLQSEANGHILAAAHFR